MTVIEVDGLVKRYGDDVVVDDVSFTVARGEIFGILGRNGAGKTTTVECLEGLRHPDAGRVRVLDLDPHHDRTQLRSQLGAQLQQARLPDKLRVGEALTLYRSFYRDGADPSELAAALGLTTMFDTPFDELSGGQQQRLSVALALVGRPRIAILDEVTTGLDPRARREVWELITRIRDEGVTVVLVSHFMDEAERLCDRIALLDHGRLVAVDTPAGLIARASLPQRIRFRHHPDVRPDRFRRLTDVTSVSATDRHVTVTGTGEAIGQTLGALLDQGVVPRDVHLQQPSLEDAFLALTDHITAASRAA